MESQEELDDARVLYAANKAGRWFTAEDVVSAGESGPELAAWVSQFGRDGARDRVQTSLDRMLAKNLVAYGEATVSFDGSEPINPGYTITGAGRESLREVYGTEEDVPEF